MCISQFKPSTYTRSIESWISDCTHRVSSIGARNGQTMPSPLPFFSPLWTGSFSLCILHSGYAYSPISYLAFPKVLIRISLLPCSSQLIVYAVPISVSNMLRAWNAVASSQYPSVIQPLSCALPCQVAQSSEPGLFFFFFCFIPSTSPRWYLPRESASCVPTKQAWRKVGVARHPDPAHRPVWHS